MKNTHQGFIGIVVAAVVALALAGAGTYYVYDMVTAPDVEVAVDTEVNATTTATTTAAVSPIPGSQWTWIYTINPNGTLTNAPENKFILSFGYDSRLTSTTDCNGLSSGFIVDGEVLSIGPIASTKMACAGETLEAEYTAELGRATSYVLVEGELWINLSKDSGVMVFEERVVNSADATTADAEVAAVTRADLKIAFKEAGTDQASGAPLTRVLIDKGGWSYDAGAYMGTCAEIASTDLASGEIAGVLCWWAGAGDEIRIATVDGKVVARHREMQEGSFDEPSFYGEFKTKFELR